MQRKMASEKRLIILGWVVVVAATFVGGEGDHLRKVVHGREACCRLAKEVYAGKAEIPFPRIMLLGATGTGKSTLGNQLLGSYYRNEDVKDKLAWTETGCDVSVGKPFSVGHSRRQAHTSSVNYTVGAFLGSGRCITVIDTMGFSDTEGRDGRHMMDLARAIREDYQGSISAFLLLFKNPTRMTEATQRQLKVYQSIFGRTLWTNAMTEITFWSHNPWVVEQRVEQCQYIPNCNNSMENYLHQVWNEGYRLYLGVPETLTVPTLFIDAVLPTFSRDERKVARMSQYEKDVFANQTSSLLNFALSAPPYECRDACRAPAQVFRGAPWVEEEELLVKLGEYVTFSCQIWTQFSPEATQEAYWTHDKGRIIYKIPLDPDLFQSNPHVSFDAPSSAARWKFADLRLGFDLGVKVTVHISNMTLEHAGLYECINGRQSENTNYQVRVKAVVDCQWGRWLPWSDCSTTCAAENDLGEVLPGQSLRRREIKFHARNGGAECKPEEGEEVRLCPKSDSLDPFSGFELCPVNCAWSAWSEWSSCSRSCLDRMSQTSIRTRSRRIVIPARNGGRECQGEEITSEECPYVDRCDAPVTVEGDSLGAGMPCSVPFRYLGKTYTSCSEDPSPSLLLPPGTSWCSTQNDEFGDAILDKIGVCEASKAVQARTKCEEEGKFCARHCQELQFRTLAVSPRDARLLERDFPKCFHPHLFCCREPLYGGLTCRQFVALPERSQKSAFANLSHEDQVGLALCPQMSKERVAILASLDAPGQRGKENAADFVASDSRLQLKMVGGKWTRELLEARRKLAEHTLALKQSWPKKTFESHGLRLGERPLSTIKNAFQPDILRAIGAPIPPTGEKSIDIALSSLGTLDPSHISDWWRQTEEYALAGGNTTDFEPLIGQAITGKEDSSPLRWTLTAGELLVKVQEAFGDQLEGVVQALIEELKIRARDEIRQWREQVEGKIDDQSALNRPEKLLLKEFVASADDAEIARNSHFIEEEGEIVSNEVEEIEEHQRKGGILFRAVDKLARLAAFDASDVLKEVTSFANNLVNAIRNQFSSASAMTNMSGIVHIVQSAFSLFDSFGASAGAGSNLANTILSLLPGFDKSEAVQEMIGHMMDRQSEYFSEEFALTRELAVDLYQQQTAKLALEHEATRVKVSDEAVLTRHIVSGEVEQVGLKVANSVQDKLYESTYQTLKGQERIHFSLIEMNGDLRQDIGETKIAIELENAKTRAQLRDEFNVTRMIMQDQSRQLENRMRRQFEELSAQLRQELQEAAVQDREGVVQEMLGVLRGLKIELMEHQILTENVAGKVLDGDSVQVVVNQINAFRSTQGLVQTEDYLDSFCRFAGSRNLVRFCNRLFLFHLQTTRIQQVVTGQLILVCHNSELDSGIARGFKEVSEKREARLAKFYLDRFHSWMPGFACQYSCPLFHGLDFSGVEKTSSRRAEDLREEEEQFLRSEMMNLWQDNKSGHEGPSFSSEECHRGCPLDCQDISPNLSNASQASIWLRDVEVEHGLWNCSAPLSQSGRECHLQCEDKHEAQSLSRVECDAQSRKWTSPPMLATLKEPLAAMKCRACDDDTEYFKMNRCHVCQCSTTNSASSACEDESGQCRCLTGWTGRICMRCPDDHFVSEEDGSCLPCDCSKVGSSAGLAERCQPGTGQCLCKHGFVGRQCDRCSRNHFAKPREVNGTTEMNCWPCQCDERGRASQDCQDMTGACLCKPGYAGIKCTDCPANTHYRHEDLDGSNESCLPCDCNAEGLLVPGCSHLLGQCHCKHGYTGRKCDKCRVDLGFQAKWFTNSTNKQCLPKPVDCIWSPWRKVGECGGTCGIGRQTMVRTEAVAAKYGGRPCTGVRVRHEPCQLEKECYECTGTLYTTYKRTRDIDDLRQHSINCPGTNKVLKKVDLEFDYSSKNVRFAYVCCTLSQSEGVIRRSTAWPDQSVPSTYVFWLPQSLPWHKCSRKGQGIKAFSYGITINDKFSANMRCLSPSKSFTCQTHYLTGVEKTYRWLKRYLKYVVNLPAFECNQGKYLTSFRWNLRYTSGVILYGDIVYGEYECCGVNV